VKLLQIWKFGGPGRDADSLDAAISIAQQHHFDGLLIKALDGTEWMSVYDAADDAIRSSEQAATQRDRCHDAGLKYYVWTNPIHNVDLEVQAQRTAAAALASDGLFLDVEPFTGPPPFWGALRPAGAADGFMRRVRELAGDVWIALQPDPRAARLAEIRPDEWLTHINAFAGQFYWTDFSPPPETWSTRARLELSNAASLGRSWEMPVLPTLPGISDPGAFPIDMLREFPGFVVYRLGTTSPEVLELLGSIPLAAPIETPPASDLDPFDTLVNALAYVCDNLGDQLQQAAGTLNGQGDSFRSVVAEMQRVRAQFIGDRPTVQGDADKPTPVTDPPDSGQDQPQVVYNADTPVIIQSNDWSCSVVSSTMALQSVGVDKDWLTIRDELADAVSTKWGLMDSRAPALVQLIEQNGFTAGVIPNNQDGGASWDNVLERAGRMPVLLGGQAWNHWTFVRGYADGSLLLGNPAPRWKGVGQTMEPQEFTALGAWTMVWIEVDGPAPEENPVRIAQLELQLSDAQTQAQQLEVQIDGLTQGLAHIVDVLVPALADPSTSPEAREDLRRTAQSIRVQQLGEREGVPA